MTKKTKTVPVVEKQEKCCDTCECTKESKCCDSCTCGETGSCCSKKGCNKSNCKTLAKCLTTLVGALMISTSILIVGSECSRPRPTRHVMPNIDAQITKYLNENSHIVAGIMEKQKARIEAEKRAEEERIRKAEEEKQAKKVAEHKDKIIADKTNHSLGNKDGKYVIIEFFDYRCGWCKKTNSALLEKIESKKAPNVRWIPVDAPIFGEGSALISRYVLAAGKQNKYEAMHHAVVKAEGNLDKAALMELAKKAGLDADKLAKDAESEEIKAKLDANIKLAQEIGVRGVPFMIVNGKPRGGALLNQALEDAIKESNEMK